MDIELRFYHDPVQEPRRNPLLPARIGERLPLKIVIGKADLLLLDVLNQVSYKTFNSDADFKVVPSSVSKVEIDSFTTFATE